MTLAAGTPKGCLKREHFATKASASHKFARISACCPHGYPHLRWIKDIALATFYGLDHAKGLKVVHFCAAQSAFDIILTLFRRSRVVFGALSGINNERQDQDVSLVAHNEKAPDP